MACEGSEAVLSCSSDQNAADLLLSAVPASINETFLVRARARDRDRT